MKESLRELRENYKAKPDGREEADRVRRVEGRPDARRGRTRRVDDAREPVDEPGRGAE